MVSVKSTERPCGGVRQWVILALASIRGCIVDLFETIEQRRSVRAFSDEQINPDSLEKILSAANQAPSAGNIQSYEIILITLRPIKEALARAALHQDFLIEAPVVLAFVTNPRRSAVQYGHRGEDLYCLQDATIACAYAQLQRHSWPSPG
jgi:nitroreductase